MNLGKRIFGSEAEIQTKLLRSLDARLQKLALSIIHKGVYVMFMFACSKLILVPNLQSMIIGLFFTNFLFLSNSLA